LCKLTGKDSHSVVGESFVSIAVLAGVPLYLKIHVRGREVPCTIMMKEVERGNLTVFAS